MSTILLLWLLTSPLSFANDASISPRPVPTRDDVKAISQESQTRQLTQELEFVGNVATLAGTTGVYSFTNGFGTNAEFNSPHGISISPDGVYALITDTYNHLIRHMIMSTASVTIWAGVGGTFGSTNGIGTNATFRSPRDVAISPDGVYALVTDEFNHLIRQIIISTVTVTTFAGIAGSPGSINGVGTNSKFYYPKGVAISPDGVYALVAESSNHLIRKIIISTASVTTLAGIVASTTSTNGIGTNAQFYFPYGIAISPDGVSALVADTGTHLIRQITISTASVVTLAGLVGSPGSANGVGTNAQFNTAYGVSISPDGVYALVADFGNQLMRQIIISTADVTTLAGVAGVVGSTNGIGTNAKFKAPYGVAISRDGGYALVAEESNSLIRQITMTFLSPSLSPSASPSPLPTGAVRYNFGVVFGDHDILSEGHALLVDYLPDLRKGK
jgi:DNA-binding beta-propeller fold protein YncE